MPLLAFGLIIFAILATIALIPLSIVQRYRVGTSRQRARGWLITLNLFGLVVSTLMFLAGAIVTNVWVPNAFLYTVAGLAAGLVLGLLGLALTRWEFGATAVHYTPSRLLVLAITLVVTARLLYGFWRAWHSWRAVGGDQWLAQSGAAGSLAAGAVVLGYYVMYWGGVRRRVGRIRNR